MGILYQRAPLTCYDRIYYWLLIVNWICIVAGSYWTSWYLWKNEEEVGISWYGPVVVFCSWLSSLCGNMNSNSEARTTSQRVIVICFITPPMGAAIPLNSGFYHKVCFKGKGNTVAYYVLGLASHSSGEQQPVCGPGLGKHFSLCYFV